MQWSEYSENTKRVQYSSVPSRTITAESVTADGFTLSQKDTAGITATATRPLAIQKDGSWFSAPARLAKHGFRSQVCSRLGGWLLKPHPAYGWDLTKNICELYGPAGYIRTAYSYTPYGEVTSDGDTEQPIQWSSEYYDIELKLVYYNWRYYNPNSGRWFSRDPIGELGSRSLFAYAHNNPVMYTDERGLKVSISADKNRCAIIVNYDIVIYNSPTHPVEQQKLETLKQTIKNAIESRWNGLKKDVALWSLKWMYQLLTISLVGYADGSLILTILKLPMKINSDPM